MKKVGLALGSGADRGFAHIGVIKALTEASIEIEAITGSSMGALIGGVYALNPDVTAMLKIAEAITPATLLKLVDLNNPTISLIKGERIKQFLRDELYGDKQIADTIIPYSAVATSLKTGMPVTINQGLLTDAVMASASIPGIFPPQEREGDILVDGGLGEAMPLAELSKMGVKVRIGVDLYSYPKTEVNTTSMKNVLAAVYRIYMSKLSTQYREHEDQEGTIIIRPETNEGIESLTFSRVKQNIEAGYLATKDKLDEIRKLLDE